jgi:hypothetical protein
MQLSFTGKILFFKKLNIQSNDVFSHFRPVPANLTFAQGVELLKKEAALSERANSARQSAAENNARENASAKPEEDAEKQLCCDR